MWVIHLQKLGNAILKTGIHVSSYKLKALSSQRKRIKIYYLGDRDKICRDFIRHPIRSYY